MATTQDVFTGQVLNSDFHAVVQTLMRGGIALIPTDTVWCIAALAKMPSGVLRLKHLWERMPADGEQPELLLDSVEQVKVYVEALHPRLETLWIYHTRPLTILFDAPRSVPDIVLRPDGAAALRLSLDDFTKALIRETNSPLVLISAIGRKGEVAANFGAISSELLQQVDYVAKYRQNEKEVGALSVMVRLDESEELDFVRE